MKESAAARAAHVAACWAFAAATAYGQDFPRIAPKPVPPPGEAPIEGPVPPPRDTQIRLRELKGIVFVRDPAELRKEGVTGVTGVDVSRIPELQNEAFQKRMERYIGRPVSLASIDDLTREVVAYYTETERPFVLAVAPEQDITSGVLQIVVAEGRVGDIRVAGAKHFPERVYRDAVRLKPGDRLDKRELDAAVDWLNRNPFRDATVNLLPGEQFATTDVVVTARDRRPFRVYGSFDDTGNVSTGNHRFAAGFNWGNVLGLDHQLNYQYTTDSDFENFKAHSLTYVVPLPWRHQLTVLGSYADIVGRVPVGFAQNGRSSQVSLRYDVPLRKIGSYSHALGAGLDYKRTNNNLEFGGLRVTAAEAEVAQGLLQYRGNDTDRLGTTSLTATFVHSPGNLTSDNRDANFQTLRAFAKANYSYANFQVQRITRLPLDFSWHASGEIQFASANLLGSEQLGLGGHLSVRGYDEREANGDRGYVLRNELRTPAWSFTPLLPGRQAQFQLLGFVDYGAVGNKQLLPGEDPHIVMFSAGLGVRFSIDQNVSARFDYGWQLRDSGVFGGRNNSRPHFSLMIAY